LEAFAPREFPPVFPPHDEIAYHHAAEPEVQLH